MARPVDAAPGLQNRADGIGRRPNPENDANDTSAALRRKLRSRCVPYMSMAWSSVSRHAWGSDRYNFANWRDAPSP